MTSPYHFAPLGPAILHSPWENGPEHGRPHEDGLCGEIRVRWRTETPTLIAGAEKDAQGRATFHKLRNADDGETLAIPGATLRGALRNILEIVTSARMIHTDATAHYAVRDMSDDHWKHFAPNPNNQAHVTISGLLLRRAGGASKMRAKTETAEGWEARVCKILPFDTADLLAHRGMGGKLGVSGGAAMRETFEALTLAGKYALLGARKAAWRLDFADSRKSVTLANGRVIHVPVADVRATRTPLSGLIAFSGPDPQRGDPKKSKKNSYVFYDAAPAAAPAPPGLMQRFLSVNGRAEKLDKDAPRSAWGFWSKALEGKATDEIPLFFVHPRSMTPTQALAQIAKTEKDGAAGAPHLAYLAMSKLVKAPHIHSPASILAAQRTDAHPERLDFVQALFGHVPPQAPADDNPPPSQRAWKGRVFFDWAELSGEDSGETLREGLTMGPKPSFWPHYLKPKPGFAGRADYSAQPNGAPGVELAGWKRYPVRGQTQDFPPTPKDDAAAADQVSKMIFRKAGATFEGVIRLHNLLPVEVGALIWAITLGASDGVGPGVRRHSIGRGKAQGHGQTSAEIVELTLERNKDGQPGDSAKHYLDLFEQWLVQAWNAGCGAAHRSVMDIDAIADLLSMSNPAVGQARLATLVYPDGTPRPGTDETRSLAGHREIKERAAKGERALARWPREPKPKT